MDRCKRFASWQVSKYHTMKVRESAPENLQHRRDFPQRHVLQDGKTETLGESLWFVYELGELSCVGMEEQVMRRPLKELL